MFLGGLKAKSKLMLDASTGRKTSLKPPREAIEITENMDVNANEFQSDRAMVPSKRLLKFNTQEGLLAQQKLPGRKIEKVTLQITNLPQQPKLQTTASTPIFNCT